MGPHTHLIPTAVVDKNGRATVVHKKPAAPSAAASAVGSIVPTVASATDTVHENVFYPTDRQIKPKNHLILIRGGTLDRRLPSDRKSHEESQYVKFSVNDLEAYDVMSATHSNVTALALLRDGIRTAEDARKALKGYEAETLIDDRSELAQKALKRRLPFGDLIEFGTAFNSELWHSGAHLDRYLDGVELSLYPAFQKIRKQAVIKDILSGKIRLSDIKTIGIRRCSTSLRDSASISLLHSLSEGKVNYTAEHIRDAFKTGDGNSFTYDSIVMMCERHGGEWASGIDWKVGAKVQSFFRRRSDRQDPDYIAKEKAVITYADAFRKRTFRKSEEIVELFEAGVGLDFAVEKSADPEAFTVKQLEAMYAGVPAAVTEGWI